MMAQVLNTIGLLSGILGAAIMFFRAPPQPDLSGRSALLLKDGTITESGRTAAEERQSAHSNRLRYARQSEFGLFLIIVAFVLQLAAVWA